ncbi:uncharacterized protein EHS24_009167 [Apiotrichum porosum]|uniref:Zinc finger CHCC-type domain-containing protein n=1 Tax=Apiotrichum porosum TaxID=105984 RepID=A0A427XNV6_9TREE|nr:uncharacterized protein EHS24_009167 [Apiotrichum porosum]RSH80585.1 hypothetical protein EHS24_009167 [Apiotrichum porosum]
MSLLRRTPLLFRSVPFLARAASSSIASGSAPAPLNLAPEPKAPGQSPNVATPWSENQEPKSAAFAATRFEQTKFDLQPDGLSAMGLVSEQPITMVHGRRAVCNGGGGALGHPKIYINLDKPGARSCGYCGARYEQEHEH